MQAREGRLRACLKHLAILMLALAVPGIATASTVPVADAFDAAIESLCTQRVVMLGEDAGHGAGATVMLKGRIVEALVDRCGFDALYFESSVYEFLALEEQLARGTAEPARLAEAIGPLWSGTREFQPTLRWLWDRASKGTLRLRGLDIQVGGVSQPFSEHALPRRLAAHAGSARVACEGRLARLTQWDFSASHPYDDAFRDALRRCLASIGRGVSGPDGQADRAMAISLGQFLDMSSGASFNTRDEGMARNFSWQHARTPGERAIIWTSTPHAVKAPLPDRPDRISLGMHLHRRLGSGLASVGFTARSGRHGRPSLPPVAIALSATSLEARGGIPMYLDRTRLRSMGPIESSVVAYRHPQLADWSALLDGIWMLPLETPLSAVEAAGSPSSADDDSPSPVKL